MTGQELIDLIQNGKLEDRHFFINVEGYVSRIQWVMENNYGDVILSQEGRRVEDCVEDKYNRERYFSEWFNIIPENDAKTLWDDGNRSFLVLRKDGTESYADSYKSWEEILLEDEVLFGLEK